MRTSSRTAAKVSSRRVVRTAGVLVVLAAILAGGSRWAIQASRPPMMSGTAPPAAAIAPAPKASVPATTRNPSRSRRHRRGLPVLPRKQHRAAVLDSARAGAAAEVGVDVSATAPAALLPQIVFSANPPPTLPAAPSTPIVAPPPAMPAPAPNN